ncbi:MAG: ATP-binding protein [Chloroflexi bacterium]|nr:ATP-binding protein [Chloroflexota bacterium]
MLILDLHWLLFGLLALLSTVTVISVYATRWSLGRRQPTILLRMLRPLFEDAPLGILILTGAQGYVYANSHARRLFQLSSGQGKLPTSVWALDLQADLEQLSLAPQGRYRTIRLTPAVNEQSPHDTGQTVRWWAIRWAAINFLFVVDLTQQQRTAQQTRFLLSDLSHELRTPLATLQTHIAVLRLTTLSEEIRTQSLHILKEETQRLVRLVNNTLELGRLETGLERERIAVDLRALVEETVTQMLPTAQGMEATITIVAASSLPPVFGQPERLKQVFLNLLDNALKYGGNNNAVTVTVQSGAEEVLCQVADTGPGIAPKHLPQLGRRFYRAAPSSMPGNGLGLALVTEILRQHQSQLKIESIVADAPGSPTGTCISFILPSRLREEIL